MSDYGLEAEREMWEAIAEQDSRRVADDNRAGGRNTMTRFAAGDLCSPRIPTRCAAHDRYDDCPDVVLPERLTHAERLDRAANG